MARASYEVSLYYRVLGMHMRLVITFNHIICGHMWSNVVICCHTLPYLNGRLSYKYGMQSFFPGKLSYLSGVSNETNHGF